MATQDKRKSIGVFDRRLDLIKPSTSRDPETNEEKTEDVIVYGNYPAMKVDKITGQSENLEQNLITSQGRVEWIVRFIPGLQISADWKIKDLFDGTIYTVIAPAVEVGFRQGYQVLTQITQ